MGLFYTTIVLLIVIVIMGFSMFCKKGPNGNRPDNFQGNPQGMTQNFEGQAAKPKYDNRTSPFRNSNTIKRPKI
jgi:hypothetical protein